MVFVDLGEETIQQGFTDTTTLEFGPYAKRPDMPMGLRGSAASRLLIMVNTLGSALPMIRIIEGAVLIFSTVLS